MVHGYYWQAECGLNGWQHTWYMTCLYTRTDLSPGLILCLLCFSPLASAPCGWPPPSGVLWVHGGSVLLFLVSQYMTHALYIWYTRSHICYHLLRVKKHVDNQENCLKHCQLYISMLSPTTWLTLCVYAVMHYTRPTNATIWSHVSMCTLWLVRRREGEEHGTLHQAS